MRTEHSQPGERPSRRAVVGRLLGVAVGLAAVACAQPAPAPSVAPTTAPPPAPTQSAPAVAPTRPATAVPTQAPTTAAKPAPSRPRELTSLRLALPAISFLSMPVYIAARQGFFREENLDVEINHIQATPTMVKGLLADELDLTFSDPAAAIAAAVEGGNLKISGGWAPLLHYFVAARKDLTSLRDLYGQPVGISQPGSLPDVVLRKLFEAEKLDIQQVDLVGVGASSARAAALVAGKIAASTFSIDEIDLIESDPNLHIMFFAADKMPQYVRGAVVVPGRRLQERPEAIEAFMRASLRATRFTFDRPDDTKALATDVLQRPRAEVERTYNYYAALPLWDPNGLIEPAKIDYMQQVNVDVGLQKATIPSARLLDQSPTERALASLGRYEIKNRPPLPKRS